MTWKRTQKNSSDPNKIIKFKARGLWNERGYGIPNMNYTNHYIQEKK